MCPFRGANCASTDEGVSEMAAAYFASIHRFRPPALVVLHAELHAQRKTAGAEAYIFTDATDGPATFYRYLQVPYLADEAVLLAAARVLVEEELQRRALALPADSRSDSTELRPADLPFVAARRTFQQYPGVARGTGNARYESVRALLRGIEPLEDLKIIEAE